MTDIIQNFIMVRWLPYVDTLDCRTRAVSQYLRLPYTSRTSIPQTVVHEFCSPFPKLIGFLYALSTRSPDDISLLLVVISNVITILPSYCLPVPPSLRGRSSLSPQPRAALADSVFHYRRLLAAGFPQGYCSRGYRGPGVSAKSEAFIRCRDPASGDSVQPTCGFMQQTHGMIP